MPTSQPDVDDAAQAAATHRGTGSGGALFPHVYRAVIGVYNKARSLKIAGFASGSFLRPLVQVPSSSQLPLRLLPRVR